MNQNRDIIQALLEHWLKSYVLGKTVTSGAADDKTFVALLGQHSRYWCISLAPEERLWSETTHLCAGSNQPPETYQIVSTGFRDYFKHLRAGEPLATFEGVESPATIPWGFCNQLYLGIVSYDSFCPFSSQDSPHSLPSRLFLSRNHIIIDWEQEVFFTVCPKSEGSSHHSWSSFLETSRHLFTKFFRDTNQDADTRYQFNGAPCPITLRSATSREHYVHQARQAIEEILSGRFYQINLLRYFDATPPNARVSPEQSRETSLLNWISKAIWHGDRYAALFHINQALTVASLSPERFVTWQPKHGINRLNPMSAESATEDTGESTQDDLLIQTFPIKGTRPRGQNQTADQAWIHELLTSRKDAAELHMIVDLMRNDFNRICKRSSVAVKYAKKLRSFPTVHHLEACVTGSLPRQTTLAQVFTALCPAGSITGAPKYEVMKAIQEFEGRERGFFMGNAFVFNPRGYFDSSVMIRTLVANHSSLEYAAGSGLVAGSIPELEATEIEHKCDVVTRT